MLKKIHEIVYEKNVYYHHNYAVKLKCKEAFSFFKKSINLPSYPAEYDRVILNSAEDFLDSPPSSRHTHSSESVDIAFNYHNGNESASLNDISFSTNMSLEASLEEERERERQKKRREIAAMEKEKAETKNEKSKSLESKSSLNSFSIQTTQLFAFREPVFSQVRTLSQYNYDDIINGSSFLGGRRREVTFNTLSCYKCKLCCINGRRMISLSPPSLLSLSFLFPSFLSFSFISFFIYFFVSFFISFFIFLYLFIA